MKDRPLDKTLTLNDDTDLVTAVAYLLGHHPADSLIAVALKDGLLRGATLLPLPRSLDGPIGDQASDEAGDAEFELAVLDAVEQITGAGHEAVLIGYGSSGQVEPALALLTDALLAAGVDIARALRVAEGRVYCLDTDCDCPAGGVPYDPGSTWFAAEATLLGVAPPQDAAAVEALLAPVTGPDRAAMQSATRNALSRLAAVLRANDAGLRPDRLTIEPPAAVIDEAHATVLRAVEGAERGTRLSDADAAWLSVVLMLRPVCGRAARACDGRDAHRQLWSDLVRRAVPPLTTAPACLLAITAHLAGDTALAREATHLALAADPDDPLARLLDDALRTGASPADLRAALPG